MCEVFENFILEYLKTLSFNKKSVVLLYTGSEQVEYEIKNTPPSILALPQMKYLGINLTK